MKIEKTTESGTKFAIYVKKEISNRMACGYVYDAMDDYYFIKTDYGFDVQEERISALECVKKRLSTVGKDISCLGMWFNYIEYNEGDFFSLFEREIYFGFFMSTDVDNDKFDRLDAFFRSLAYLYVVRNGRYLVTVRVLE